MYERINLADYGNQLWTRELAKKIRNALEEVLERIQPGETIIIDTKGVEVFDYSFANELFAKIQLSLSKEYTDRFILIEGLTKYTHENLSRALESLNLIMMNRKGNKLELIGKVHPTDQETFGLIAAARSPISATQLKDKLNINLNAMNERLSKLISMGVVRRTAGVSESGRQQYLYSVLC